MIQTILAFLSLLLAGYLCRITYQAYFGPLSKVPLAHWTARWPALYVLHSNYSTGKKGLAYDLQHLHSIKGPIIRYGPTSVSVSDPQSYNEIYGNVRSGFLKSKLLISGTPLVLAE
jgi:hypothetical protein